MLEISAPSAGLSTLCNFTKSAVSDAKAKLPEPSVFINCDAEPSATGSCNSTAALLVVVEGALRLTDPPPLIVTGKQQIL